MLNNKRKCVIHEIRGITASADGSDRAISLTGNYVAVLHLTTPVFFWRAIILVTSNEIKSRKEHETQPKKSSIEAEEGEEEKIATENQRKPERNRARDRVLIYNG